MWNVSTLSITSSVPRTPATFMYHEAPAQATDKCVSGSSALIARNSSAYCAVRGNGPVMFAKDVTSEWPGEHVTVGGASVLVDGASVLVDGAWVLVDGATVLVDGGPCTTVAWYVYGLLMSDPW